MTERALTLARAGDQDAFRELTDPYRHELQLHCYRILGSTQDAEDLVQETLLAAWRGLESSPNGRRSAPGCTDRNQPLGSTRCERTRAGHSNVGPMTELPEPSRVSEPIWLEPYPDIMLEGIADQAPGPAARYETKETIALAFVAGLQHLPPQQRAVLVLRDVLSFQATEVAEMLDSTDSRGQQPPATRTHRPRYPPARRRPRARAAAKLPVRA